jgi:hypothetical protein
MMRLWTAAVLTGVVSLASCERHDGAPGATKAPGAPQAQPEGQDPAAERLRQRISLFQLRLTYHARRREPTALAVLCVTPPARQPRPDAVVERIDEREAEQLITALSREDFFRRNDVNAPVLRELPEAPYYTIAVSVVAKEEYFEHFRAGPEADARLESLSLVLHDGAQSAMRRLASRATASGQ